MKRILLFGALAMSCSAGDGGDDDDPVTPRDSGVARDGGRDGGPRDAGPRDGGPRDAGPRDPLALTTAAFADGDAVPQRYQCGPPLFPRAPGLNVSPALSWNDGPPETMSWAIVLRDRSAGGLVHWAIYDIPAETREIAEDVPSGYMPTVR